MAKVDRLLATLRGEAPPEEAPPPEAAADGGGASVPSAEFEALKAKIAELEEKMGQMAAPPPMDMPVEPPTEEVPPALPPEPPPPPPPAAPTEVALFMQTRMELLERKLELAQQEALRSGLLLREREDAQRKAQGEVEDLFRSMREAQRAASYDKAVREHAAAAEARAKELEARLAMAELRMVPAEEVLRFVETEEGRAELVRRLGEQLSRAASAPAAPPAAPSAASLPPAGGPVPFETLAAVLGRVSDLERRLADSERERVRQAEDRKRWEAQVASSLSTAASRFARAGGPELLVEAALEAVVESVRRRDALQVELSAAVSALQDEPPGSERGAELRGKLALAYKEMAELQADIEKQLALVRAWVERESGGGT